MNDLISSRKQEHISICMDHDVEYQNLSTGFEKVLLSHCALPEINFEDIDTTTTFLDKTLSFPLMITGMTGGHENAKKFNQQLIEICEDEKIALGLGSQRQALGNDQYLESYQIVRKIAQKVPIIGNIGAAQIIAQKQRSEVHKLVESLEPDALAVHLNPLQEILQPEGDFNFKGVLNGIEKLIKLLPIPVIVKETGAGISGAVALRLKEIGVKILDISGAGGTSWAAVEYFRTKEKEIARKFWDWGIPTVQCLKEVSRISGLKIIAAGGIRDGTDMAKSIVLGADLSGAALPFLKTLIEKGPTGVKELIRVWRKEFKITMFLTGCRKIQSLKNVVFYNI